ncbi:tRNA-binding protein [Patescibacteria group bacterium]
MSQEIKSIVSKEETFDKLEIRLGRIILVEEAIDSPKRSYLIKVDFGKFGIKQTVGRFTQHPQEELKDKIVLGVLNFEPRKIGLNISEFLLLGVQYPKADSGEATIITPLVEPKIGGKIF